MSSAGERAISSEALKEMLREYSALSNKVRRIEYAWLAFGIAFLIELPRAINGWDRPRLSPLEEVQRAVAELTDPSQWAFTALRIAASLFLMYMIASNWKDLLVEISQDDNDKKSVQKHFYETTKWMMASARNDNFYARIDPAVEIRHFMLERGLVSQEDLAAIRSGPVSAEQ